MERFNSWKASPFRHAHNPQLLGAILDVDFREELFEDGLDSPIKDEVGEGFEIVNEKQTGYFDEESFSLMASLEKILLLQFITNTKINLKPE